MKNELIDEDAIKHNFQKEHWQEFLEQYDAVGGGENFGFEWGDPDDESDRHGNYKAVKELLLKTFSKDSVVLEIGALGGKWTQYLLHAKKIIAVDINDYFVDYLKRKFSKSSNLEFYISRGNELNGIDDNSVDMVFSMDTFSRVQKKYIWDYFREVERILTDSGMAILHLPNDDLPISKNRGFTPLTTDEINSIASQYFVEFCIDSDTLLHGSLLIVKKVK